MQSSVLEEMNFVQEHNSLILRKAKEITVRLQLSIQSAKLTKNQQLHTRQDPCDEKTTSSMLYKKSGQQSNIWLTYSMVYLPCFTD